MKNFYLGLLALGTSFQFMQLVVQPSWGCAALCVLWVYFLIKEVQL